VVLSGKDIPIGSCGFIIPNGSRGVPPADVGPRYLLTTQAHAPGET